MSHESGAGCAATHRNSKKSAKSRMGPGGAVRRGSEVATPQNRPRQTGNGTDIEGCLLGYDVGSRGAGVAGSGVPDYVVGSVGWGFIGCV